MITETFELNGETCWMECAGIETAAIVYVLEYMAPTGIQAYLKTECRSDKSLPRSVRFQVQDAQAIIAAAPLAAQVMELLGEREWFVKATDNTYYALFFREYNPTGLTFSDTTQTEPSED
jgi:hypothetical protein